MMHHDFSLVMGLSEMWCQMCECNLTADKEEKGEKDTFIFCEVLILLFFQIETFCYLLF